MIVVYHFMFAIACNLFKRKANSLNENTCWANLFCFIGMKISLIPKR